MAVKAGVYGGRTQEERRAERRARLLEATLEVWGGDGAGPVTMTRVCAAAGLSERYFYEQFSQLDDALGAVLEAVAGEIAHASTAALEAATGPVEKRVRAGLAAFVQVLTDDPRKGRIAMIESVAVPALRARRSRLLHDFVDLTAREARALRTGDDWDDRAGALAATMFVGGIAQLVTDWLEGRLTATPDEVTDAATRLFAAVVLA